MSNPQKNFYIFRHGESTYNIRGLIQGHTNDSVLTETGVAQAHQTGKKLSRRSIDILISSPLRRAQETSEIVASHIKVPIIYDDDFIEVNVGIIEGMHYTDVEKEFGDLYKRWRSCAMNDTETKFKNGETKMQVRQRVFKALTKYAKESKYRNFAISAHGIIIMQVLLAMGIEKNDIPNGSVVHLTYQSSTWNFNGFLE